MLFVWNKKALSDWNISIFAADMNESVTESDKYDKCFRQQKA